MTHTHKLSRLLIFVLIFSLGLVAVHAQDNAPELQFVPDKTEAVTGDTITVTANIVGAVGVYGGSFKLGYDVTAFEVVQTENQVVTPGAFFADEPGFALRNAVDTTAGTIEYAITLMQPAKPVDGDGVLGTFVLRALKDAPVELTSMNASFVAPEFTEVDGHLVAQKVNQVTAQVSGVVGSAPVAPVSSVAAVEPSTVEVAPTAASLSDEAVVEMFSNPQLDAAAAQADVNPAVIPAETISRTDNAVSTAAIIFLVLGIVLLTLSVGMYSRMRVHYTLVGNK
ncbi:MAG: cohesin domain-containing protein [Chloroflexi bacterium]|nr:cohesin domain-containing protein [Chloroflexota bacterium]MCC6897059.1 hypothetical protein [Anaerolineae bacterium]